LSERPQAQSVSEPQESRFAQEPLRAEEPCALPSSGPRIELPVAKSQSRNRYDPHFPEHYRQNPNVWVNVLWHAWVMIALDFDENVYRWAREYALPVNVLEAFVCDRLFSRNNDIEATPIEWFIQKLDEPEKQRRRGIRNPLPLGGPRRGGYGETR